MKDAGRGAAKAMDAVTVTEKVMDAVEVTVMRATMVAGAVPRVAGTKAVAAAAAHAGGMCG